MKILMIKKTMKTFSEHKRQILTATTGLKAVFCKMLLRTGLTFGFAGTTYCSIKGHSLYKNKGVSKRDQGLLDIKASA